MDTESEGREPNNNKRYVKIVRALHRIAGQQQRTNDQNDASDSKKELREWLTIIGIYAALIATIGQWQVAREAMAASQRAFVPVDGLEIVPNQSMRRVKSWTMNPIIRNSGNSPTKNLTHKWTLVPYDRDEEDTAAVFPETRITDPLDETWGQPQWRGNISPQQRLDTPYTKGILTVADISDPAVDVYVFSGIISYEDIFPFSDVHITKYCFIITAPETEQKKGSPVKRLVETIQSNRCRYWNCVDSECEHDKQQHDEDMGMLEAAKNELGDDPHITEISEKQE